MHQHNIEEPLMKTFPRILSVGSFDPYNLNVGNVVYEAPLSRRQRSALKKRTQRFCVKHCGGSQNRIYLDFQGCTVLVKQRAICTKPFTEFHYRMLVNQKLASNVGDKALQEQIVNTAPDQVLAIANS